MGRLVFPCTIYARLEEADLDANGKLHLVLSKENKNIILWICKFLRENYLNNDILLQIALLPVKKENEREKWNRA